ncbi:uncharacterized membrane protein YjfL (UPF0719 family) [Actinoalloteichus hymeniacidonis]|uniref:DUF350 family protein n=2 Tax=Actinoalloteichus hymeniacidonis TaxID=340345 RepID=A0AAC9MW77_9PSEU|nr:putative DUF350 family protein [Actinoalloteichus hymeniacidonis]MBB5911025.1 uncharacterized membrane protein YjfL (UPF0719 family) [Actinoalloteichus hymeniacidonis]
MVTMSVAQTTLALSEGFLGFLGGGVGAIALYAILGLLLMLVGFYAIDLTTPGKLNELVRAGKPNAVVLTASGLFSMAFIVVVAIFNAGGGLIEGLLAAMVFGLVGIVAQVLAVRVLEWAAGIQIGQLIHADELTPASFVVGAAHLGLGLVVAVAVA